MMSSSVRPPVFKMWLIQAWCPSSYEILRGREAPNTIRNAATIGGTVGTADPESELLAGLLAYGATVTLARTGSQTDSAT